MFIDFNLYDKKYNSLVFFQMVRPKSKRNKWMKNVEPEPTDPGIPIPNLTEKFLLMRVNFRMFTE